MKKITLILILNCYIITSSDKTESSNNLDIHRKRFNVTPIPEEVRLGKEGQNLTKNPQGLIFFNTPRITTSNQSHAKYLSFCNERKKRTEEHNKYLEEIQPDIERRVSDKPELGNHPLEIIENIDIWNSDQEAWGALLQVQKKIKEWSILSPQRYEPIPITESPIFSCHYQNDEMLLATCNDDFRLIDTWEEERDQYNE